MLGTHFCLSPAGFICVSQYSSIGKDVFLICARFHLWCCFCASVVFRLEAHLVLYFCFLFLFRTSFYTLPYSDSALVRLACSLWSHYPSVLANSFIHKNILLYKQKPDSTFFSLFNYLFVWLPWFILVPPHFTSFFFLPVSLLTYL